MVANTGSNGAIKGKYTYAAFGSSNSQTGAPFLYAGMRVDAETGTFYARARAYNPALGRFLQSDPIGPDGGINLYDYVGSDPLNKTDTRGTCGGPFAIACVGFAAGEMVVAETAPLWVPYVAETIVGVGSFLGGLITGSSVTSQALDSVSLPSILFMKPPANAWPPDGPKAPGYPGNYPGIGYEDPKGGPNWAPNPNGKGWGWEDKAGDVWVPTGPRPGLAHGGPHYDVESPGGDYRNVKPPKGGASEFQELGDGFESNPWGLSNSNFGAFLK